MGIKRQTTTLRSAKKLRKTIPILIEQQDSKSRFTQLKLFNKWDTSNITVTDVGLKPYITLSPQVVPVSYGRHSGKQFWKSKKHIVERLIGKMEVTGHKGKKHYWTSGIQSGKMTTQYNILKKALELVEVKTKINPIQVLVKAIEAGAAREGTGTIEYGGIRYPKAAELSPQRRVDLTLRWMCLGAFLASRKNKKSMAQALADEIVAASANDQAKSMCVQKKVEVERQAQASR